MASNLSSLPVPVLNQVVHPINACQCGKMIHDPGCPLSGTCPLCGFTQNTCRLLNQCQWSSLAHPTRVKCDNELLVERMQKFFSGCDAYGNSLRVYHIQIHLPHHLLKRIADLNAQYWEIKKWIPYNVGQLKQIEDVLAKLRRLYIEVKASRTAKPTRPSQTAHPAQPTRPSQPAKRFQEAKQAGIAKSAQPAQPTDK